MSKVGHNRIQLGDDSDPNKNFVIGTPSPNDGTLEVRKGTVEVPGDLVARFTGASLELGATGQAIKSAAFLDAVGTVSQVGGVPTGAILEYGSNANGAYTKFANGLMITHSVKQVAGVSTFAYPHQFAVAPYVFATPISGGETTYIQPATQATYDDVSVSIRVLQITSGSVVTRTAELSVRVLAIGYWF